MNFLKTNSVNISHFNFKMSKALDGLLALAQTEEQKKLLHKWFKDNHKQVQAEFDVPKRHLDQSDSDLARYMHHRVREQIFRMAELLAADQSSFVLEEVSPENIQGGYVVGEHAWGPLEKRFRVGLLTVDLK